MILTKGGDHRAFSTVYDRYAGRLKAFFYRMLWSDEEMAEDYVQDLFTKIIVRPELYDPTRAFSPWLFQIASNMCKNAYRKRSFEKEYLNQLEKNGIQTPSIDQHLDEKILTDQLHKTLEKLDEDKRELFLLRYQQQLSTKELAAAFNTSEGTIKSRLFYIRKTLLEALGEKETSLKNGK